MNIKDPEERDAMIEDYLIDRQRDLEETQEPIVASNQKMTQDVIKDLIPIKEELKEINRNIDNLLEEHLQEDFGAATPHKRFKKQQ